MKRNFLSPITLAILIAIVANNHIELLYSQVEQQSIEAELQTSLVGHWPAVDQPLEVSADSAPRLSTNEFSLALWIRHDELSDRPGGDIVSQYDPKARRGFHLTLKCNPGVTSNQANWRHLQFGIDDDRASEWHDCGRPGSALFAFSMAAHNGDLYVGTCEPGKQESGRIYRYQSNGNWHDCGSLDGSNSVTAMAVFQGSLFAGTGKYRVSGSSLPESENTTLGGRVFRLEADGRWIDCGQLPEAEAVGGLVQFRGQLYASSLYKPAGFYRYEGLKEWASLPIPIDRESQYSDKVKSGDNEKQVSQSAARRVVSMGVFDGYLYATSYDCGHVYRFDGASWTDCGLVGDNTQCYAFANYGGKLHVATWPSGRVFRFEGIGNWLGIGRLGDELEVMGMIVHNGRFIAGTLPKAQVYAYDGGQEWSLLEQLDRTPEVRYRRAWTMCEYGGKLYCSTLPSGRIFSFTQGRQVSWDYSLDSNWHHVVAVKSNNRLSLWVDGKCVSQSQSLDSAEYMLESNAAWRLADGINGGFEGQIRELRVYLRALTTTDIGSLFSRRPE